MRRKPTLSHAKAEQTSIGSIFTREHGEPSKGGKANEGIAKCLCTLRQDGRLAPDRMATSLPEYQEAASAYRKGYAGRQMGQGESPATSTDPLVQRQSFGRQTGDREPRQKNTGRGRRDVVHTGSQIERRVVVAAEGLPADAPQTHIYPQVQGRKTSDKYSDYDGQGDASIVFAGVAARSGDNGGQSLFWVPNSKKYRGCNRKLFQSTWQDRIRTMDFRGGHQRLFRQHQPCLATRQYSHEQIDTQEMAEGGLHGR